jgi:hypothetical protein
MIVHCYFRQKWGCVAINHRPEAHTPHPTYVSIPYLTFLDFWWIPFLGQNLLMLVFDIIENGRSWQFSSKMGLCGH